MEATNPLNTHAALSHPRDLMRQLLQSATAAQQEPAAATEGATDPAAPAMPFASHLQGADAAVAGKLDPARAPAWQSSEGGPSAPTALQPSNFIGGAKHASGDSQHDQLSQQAGKWVAQTFFGTLLKQMHESPFKSNLLDGGHGGQAFSSLYDQRLADHMARGAGTKLVRSIVRQIEGRRAYSRQSDKASAKMTRNN